MLLFLTCTREESIFNTKNVLKLRCTKELFKRIKTLVMLKHSSLRIALSSPMQSHYSNVPGSRSTVAPWRRQAVALGNRTLSVPFMLSLSSLLSPAAARCGCTLRVNVAPPPWFHPVGLSPSEPPRQNGAASQGADSWNCVLDAHSPIPIEPIPHRASPRRRTNDHKTKGREAEAEAEEALKCRSTEHETQPKDHTD